MNFMWFDKFGFQGYSSDWKLDIIKQGMSGWPGNDGKMTSQNNFKLRFLERSLDLVRDFLFQFGLIGEVWLPVVIISVKNGHCKTRNGRLAGQRRRKTSHSNLRISASKRPLGADRGYLC